MPYVPFSQARKQKTTGYIPYNPKTPSVGKLLFPGGKSRALADIELPSATTTLQEEPRGFLPGLASAIGGQIAQFGRQAISGLQGLARGEFSERDIRRAAVGGAEDIITAPAEIIQSPLRFATEATITTLGQKEPIVLNEIFGEKAGPIISEVFGQEELRPFGRQVERGREVVRELGGTRTEQTYLPYGFIVLGGFADFWAKPTKPVFKKIAKETSEQAIEATLKQNIKNIPDDTAKNWARQLKNVSDPEAVERYIKRETREFAEQTTKGVEVTRSTREAGDADALSERALNDWEENFAPRYGELEGEIKKLETQQKAARAQERLEIQQQIDQRVTEQVRLEESFIEKYKPQGIEEVAPISPEPTPGAIPETENILTQYDEFRKIPPGELISEPDKRFLISELDQGSQNTIGSGVQNVEISNKAIKHISEKPDKFPRNVIQEMPEIVSRPDEIRISNRSNRFAFIKRGAGQDATAVIVEVGENKNTVVTAFHGKYKDMTKMSLASPRRGGQITPTVSRPKDAVKRVTDLRYKDLNTIAEKIKEKDLTNVEFDELQSSLDAAREAVFADPAKPLARYTSRTTGELPEVTGKGPGIFSKQGDQIIQELGLTEDEAIRGVSRYLEARSKLRQIETQLSALREKRSAIRKGEHLMRLAKGDRRVAFRAVRNAFDLTDAELSRIRGGRDIMSMEKFEFEEFIRKAEALAEEAQKTRAARTQLEFTIQEKEFRKLDNLRLAMKLPPIQKMNAEQLDSFDAVLQQFKQGDEFLGVRQLETVKNTDLAGIKTIREAKERLAKQMEVSVEQLSEVKVKELDRFLYDVSLAERNPFYRMMVEENTKATLNANARFFNLKKEVNTLISAARKSRPKGVLEKLIPTDKKIFEWLEADDLKKFNLAKEMTIEELRAAQRIRDLYIEARDYLVQMEVLKKYRSDYITHIRRGFLEAWKEDGFMTAFREMFDQYKLDEAMFNILDQKTGEILPLEKFFQFSMRRTGVLKPTENVASAVQAYFRAFYKKQALDSIVPKIDIYAHALTPKKITPRGLDYDDSLKRFVKQWLNTKKGRPAEALLVKPGGRIDWALRMGTALTRMLDLGFGIPIGVAASVGEQVMTFISLGPKKYTLGLTRWATRKGREITNRYPEFVGEPLTERFADASRAVDDKILEAAFSLFAEGSRKANQIVLLGSMTKEEFARGAISAERLANLRLGVGKFRVVEGFDSIFGATAPGKVMKQYRTWAVPIFSTVTRDSLRLAKQLKSGKFTWTPENQALLRAIVTTSVLGIGLYGYYKGLENKKDRTFSEDLAFKAARDALTSIQALDAELWTRPARLADFVEDLGRAAHQIYTIEQNASGELKGPKTLQRTLTPSPLKSLLREERTPSTRESGRRRTTSPGLPPLPELPALPQLPSLPTP